MCDYKTWTHFLGAAMFIPRLADNRSFSNGEGPTSLVMITFPARLKREIPDNLARGELRRARHQCFEFAILGASGSSRMRSVMGLCVDMWILLARCDRLGKVRGV